MGEAEALSAKPAGRRRYAGTPPLRTASSPPQEAGDFGVVANLGPGKGGVAVAAAEVYVCARRDKRFHDIRICLDVLTGKNQGRLSALVE